MTVTRYFWDPLQDNATKEYDENGDTIVRYTTEPDLYGNLISQERDGVASYYHYDGQGSTLALTNEHGDVTDEYAYSAFGEAVTRVGVTANPFGYMGAVGYYMDSDTDGVYVRERTYEPKTARWLSLDPIWASDNLSYYHYAKDSPLIFRDPSGTQPGGGKVDVGKKVELIHEVVNKTCSGCGGFKLKVHVSIGEVTGFKDPRSAPYYLVQRLCHIRGEFICDANCGGQCRIVDSDIPDMACCNNEILGHVEIGSRGAILYNVDKKRKHVIDDTWAFFSLGDSDCHSRGLAYFSSDLYLVPLTDEIEHLYNSWRPKDVPCLKRVVTVGPGPKEIDVKEAIGTSNVAAVGYWDCCPKDPTKSCEIRFGRFVSREGGTDFVWEKE